MKNNRDFVKITTTTILTWNLMYMARILKVWVAYLHTEINAVNGMRDAGFDHPNPDYR